MWIIWLIRTWWIWSQLQVRTLDTCYTVSFMMKNFQRSWKYRQYNQTSFTQKPRLSRYAQFYVHNHYAFVFLIHFMSFTIFLLDSPSEDMSIGSMANRMSLTLSLFLSLVAYKFAIANSLPALKYMTHFDKYCSTCFTLLFAQFVGQGICFRYFEASFSSLQYVAYSLITVSFLAHLVLTLTALNVNDNTSTNLIPSVRFWVPAGDEMKIANESSLLL